VTAEPRHEAAADGDPEPAHGDAAPESAAPRATAAPDSDSPPATAAPETAAAPLPQHKIRRTRISGLWVAIGFFAVVLLLLLIFILQNNHTVDISYFGFHGHLPLGVALLLAAVSGILLVGLAGTARILQLRAAARRHRRADQNVTVPPPR
jgi:uncharacterized integral membrane protein